MPLYSNWLLGVLNGAYSTDWDTDTIKVALYADTASSYITNCSGSIYWSQIASGEISGAGYTASGQALSGMTVDFLSHNPCIVRLDANNPSWPTSTITARFAVIYKYTGNSATSPLIGWVDFGSNQSSSSGTFEIQWSASGIVGIISPWS